jgi:ABC-type glycerol-3-phosphate transport system permease component
MSAIRLRKLILGRILPMAYLALVGIFAVFPFLWMVLTSLKPTDQIFVNPPVFVPRVLYFDAYLKLLTDPNFLKYMRNSLIVATATAVATTVCACLAAYAFSKFSFRGNQPLSFSLFLSQLFPQAVILVPLFIIFRHLGLYDTYGALILANMVFAVPVSTWLMIGFFDSIPSELTDAALIDGSSKLGALYHIILPIAKTGVVATAMYIFIGSWSELLFAVTFTTDLEVRTLPLALSNFIGQYTQDWNGLLAASTLTGLPVVIIFLMLQRFFVDGITSGALKG